MPVHDWTLVDAGIFHDFHVAWIAELRTALNSGLLPDQYYPMAEQHAGRSIADVLTLYVSPFESESAQPLPRAGGTAVAEMPLFLTPERYVNVPLEGTYGAAYAGMPAFWKDVLEGRGTRS